jgi:hypothetical protein
MDLGLTRTKSAAGTALMSLDYHELVRDGRGFGPFGAMAPRRIERNSRGNTPV